MNESSESDRLRELRAEYAAAVNHTSELRGRLDINNLVSREDRQFIKSWSSIGKGCEAEQSVAERVALKRAKILDEIERAKTSEELILDKIDDIEASLRRHEDEKLQIKLKEDRVWSTAKAWVELNLDNDECEGSLELRLAMRDLREVQAKYPDNTELIDIHKKPAIRRAYTDIMYYGFDPQGDNKQPTLEELEIEAARSRLRASELETEALNEALGEFRSAGGE